MTLSIALFFSISPYMTFLPVLHQAAHAQSQAVQCTRDKWRMMRSPEVDSSASRSPRFGLCVPPLVLVKPGLLAGPSKHLVLALMGKTSPRRGVLLCRPTVPTNRSLSFPEQHPP